MRTIIRKRGSVGIFPFGHHRDSASNTHFVLLHLAPTLGLSIELWSPPAHLVSPAPAHQGFTVSHATDKDEVLSKPDIMITFPASEPQGLQSMVSLGGDVSAEFHVSHRPIAILRGLPLSLRVPTCQEKLLHTQARSHLPRLVLPCQRHNPMHFTETAADVTTLAIEPGARHPASSSSLSPTARSLLLQVPSFTAVVLYFIFLVPFSFHSFMDGCSFPQGPIACY